LNQSESESIGLLVFSPMANCVRVASVTQFGFTLSGSSSSTEHHAGGFFDEPGEGVGFAVLDFRNGFAKGFGMNIGKQGTENGKIFCLHGRGGGLGVNNSGGVANINISNGFPKEFHLISKT
jgi:hypothetical protein